MTKKTSLYIRNFVFGVEDSLVSTGGVITGIALAGVEKETILMTGIVVICVEAFSMGAGSFLSEQSVQSYTKDTEHSFKKAFAGGAIMFLSYSVAGFIPLAPYLIWDCCTAIPISIVSSLIALFILGVLIARISKINMFYEGLKMVAVGGMAMLLGRIAGSIIG
ncbi:MAG: VIT1/CCC1 transporter family protein [Parcubacteria group bacterium]